MSLIIANRFNLISIKQNKRDMPGAFSLNLVIKNLSPLRINGSIYLYDKKVLKIESFRFVILIKKIQIIY